MIGRTIQQIRLALAARSGLNKIKEAKVKSGIRSSEFWIVVATVVASIWGAAGGLVSPELTTKIVGIVVAIYTIARTVVKATASTKDDELLDKIKEIFEKK